MYINNFENYLISNQSSPCTIKAYKTAIKQMLDFVGKDETEIVFDDFINWKNYMMKNYALNSVSQKVMAIRSYFKYLTAAKVISYNPTVELKGAKVKHPEMKALSEDEVKAMIKSAKGRDRAIIATLYSTGIRVSELINLTVNDVKGNETTITGKGDKDRKIYFNDMTKQYINEYMPNRKSNDNTLFISNQGSKMKEQNISNMLKRVATKTGLFDDVSWVSPHTMRRTRSSVLAEHGVPITTIQKILGHASITTTQLYIKPQNSSMRDAIMNY